MRKWLLSLMLCLFKALPALALPEQPSVVHGSVQTSKPAANVVQILQSSPQAIINWNAFNIGPKEVVRFLQPDRMSTLLNRVTGADPSYIQGLIQANGRIFLINPNGILFGPGSVVDVGSFMASTLRLSDADFLAGKYNLIQAPDKALAAIVNQGTLKVADGGFLVLASPLIHNDGLIVARGGQVSLGATRQATFSVDGQGLLQFAVPDGFNHQFTGGGQGGTVLMTQGQVSNLLSQVVANPGIVEAGSLDGGPAPAARGAEGLLLNSGAIQVDGNPGQKAGSILLNSSQATVLSPTSRLSANGIQGDAGEIRALSAGTTVSAGNLQARADGGGDGGFIEVSGKRLGMTSGADLGASHGHPGRILLDPATLTIVEGAANTGDLDFALPTVLSATTNGTDTVSTGAIAAIVGTVTLDATHQIIYNGGAGLTAPNTDLVLTAGNDILFNVPSVTAHSIQLNAGRNVITNGNFDLTTTGGDVRVAAGGDVVSGSGIGQPVRWTSAGNLSIRGASVNVTGSTLVLNATGDLTLESTAGRTAVAGLSTSLNSTTGKIVVNASGADALLQSGFGQPLNVTSARGAVVNASTNTSISGGVVTVQGNLTLGGNNITVNADSWDGGNVTFQAGQNIDLFPGPITVNALTVNAANDITFFAFPVVANGDLNVNGGGTFQFLADSVNATGNLSLQSGAIGIISGPASMSSGNNTLINSTAGNLQFDVATVNIVSASGNVTLNSSRDVVLNLGGGESHLSGSQVLVSATNNIIQTTPGGFVDYLMLTGKTATLQAGQDVNLVLYSLQHATAGPFAPGQAPNVTVSAGGNLSMVSAGNALVRANSLTMTAGNELTLNTSPFSPLSVLTTGGDIRLNAAGNLSTSSGGHSWTSAGNLNLQAQAVKVEATLEIGPNRQIFFFAPSGGIALNATAGNVLVNGCGQVTLNAPGGAVVLNATGGDVLVKTVENDRALFFSPQAQIGATGDVILLNNVTGPGPDGIRMAQANIQSGRDLIVNTSILTSTNLTAQAGRDLSLSSPLTRTRVNLTNSTLTAGRDLTFGPSANTTMNATGQALFTAGRNLTTNSANTTINGGANLTLSAGSDLNLAPAQNLILNATSVSLSSNGTLEFPTAPNVTTVNNLNVQAAGPLNVTPLNLTAVPGNLTLSGGNLVYNGNPVAVGGSLALSSTNDIAFNTTSVTARDQQWNAGRNVQISSPGQLTLTTTTGDLSVAAGGNLTSTSGLPQRWISAGTLAVTGSSVNVTAPTVAFNATANLTMSSSAGNLGVSGQSINLYSNTGQILVNASGGDTLLQTSTLQSLNLTAASQIVVNSSNDTVLNTLNAGQVMLNGTTVTLEAGRDVLVTADGVNGSGPAATANLVVSAGRNFNLTGGTGGNTAVVLNALDVQAANINLAGNGHALGVNSTAGNVRFNATAGNLRIDATTMNILSPSGNVTLNAGGGDVLLNLGGGDSTLAGSQIIVSASNNIIQTGPLGNLIVNGTAANLQAGGNLNLSLTGLQNTGPDPTLTLAAGANLSLSSPSALTVRGSSVNMTAGNDLNLNSGPASTLAVTSTAGDTRLSAGGTLSTSSGNHSWASAANLNLQGQSILVNATGPVNMQSASLTLNATGGDLRLQTTGPQGMNLPQANLQASQDIVVNGSALASTNLTAQSGRDFLLTGPTGVVQVNLTNSTLAAGRDLTYGPASNVSLNATREAIFTAGRNLTTPANSTSLNAGGNLTLAAGSDLNLSPPQSLVLNATSVSLSSNGTIELPAAPHITTLGDLNLQVAGPLNVSPLNLTVPGNLTLSGGNLIYNGGNPVAAGGVLALSSGNDIVFNTTSVTAQSQHWNAGGNVQISSPGQLNVTTTGGNLQMTAGGNLSSTSAGSQNWNSSGALSVQGALVDLTAGGNLSIAAGQDLTVNATGGHALISGQATTLTSTNGRMSVNATGGEARIQSAPGQPLNLTALQGSLVNSSTNSSLSGGPVTVQGNLTAQGQNVSLAGNSWNGGNTTVQALSNVNLLPGPMTVNALNVTAGNDINITSSPLQVTGNLSINGGGTLHLNSDTLSATGNLILQSPTVFVNGGALSISGGGATQINATGGTLRVDATTMNIVSPGGNVTLNASGGDVLLNLGAGDSLLGGSQVVVSATNNIIQTGPLGNLIVNGTTANFQAGGNLNFNLTGLQNTGAGGNLNLGAGNSLSLASPNALAVQGTSINMTAGNSVSLQGQSILVNGSGPVNLQSGSLALNATGGDLRLQTTSPLGMNLPQASLQATQDIVVNTSLLTSSNLTGQAGRDLLFTSPTGGLQVNLTNSTLTAGRDLTYGPAGNVSLNANREAFFRAGRNMTTPSNSTSLNAGGNLTLAAGSDLNLAPPQNLVLNATSLTLSSNGTMEFPATSTLTGLTGLTLQGGANLDVTPLHLVTPGNLLLSAGNQLLVNQLSAPNVNLSGGNIVLTSFQNATGGNYIITTPGNLSERVATSNNTAPQLTSLNISANQIFGVGDFNSFSIPSTTGTSTVQVTGGNDSFYQAAASMARLQGANFTLLTVPTTGDIYVDGVLQKQSSPTPPPPAPTAATPGAATPLTSRTQLSDAQQAELLAALAQSNPGLGNTGSFSRVLSPVERERLTVRNDSLKSTAAMMDPFSPTLALVLDPSWDAQLMQDLAFLTATMGEELREKDRASFNAMVDMEIREIWEVRYWRRLLEGFIIWEDKGD